VVQDLIS